MRINLVAACLQFFVNVDGKPQLVTKSVILYAVSNIVLDLIFILVLDWGMRGAALATIVSQILSITILASHFKNKIGTLYFVNPFKDFISVLKGNLKQGAPMIIGGLSTSIIFLFINGLVLNTLGVNGVFILSVCMQIVMILTFAVQGAGNSIQSIGGVLIGENDILRLHALVRRAFLFMNSGVILLSALIFLFPVSVIRLFGAESSALIEDSVIPVRIFICGLIFSANFSILNYLYQLLGHLKACSLFSLLHMLALLLFMWIFSLSIPKMLWIFFPLAFLFQLIIQHIYARIVSGKHFGMHRITLIPAEENHVVFDRSVNYSESDTIATLNEISSFMEAQQIKKATANNVILCCEELMLNLITYAKNKNDKRSFDIHITHTTGGIKVSIKDDGKPFNPTLEYQRNLSVNLTDDDVKISV